MGAVSFIGVSNLITTNGGAPGAITPHASTANGDLMIFFHYSRATGGNETVTLPTGFTSVFNGLVANNGLLAVGFRVRQSGDTTHTATITNHTSSTTGETVLEFIETYRGQKVTNPIVQVTASLSTWASSLNLGSIAAPATATVNPNDMVVVFAGRFENITAQTVLTGDSLTWTNRTLIDTTLGSDAGAVTQTGLNATGSNQTVTAKTITTTGTTQAGAGIMFIIEEEPDPAAISETNAVTDTVSASITQTRYPVPLGTTVEGTTASGTSHIVTLPSGIQAGELLFIFCGAKNVAFNSVASGQWVMDTTGTGVVGGATYWKVADGTESGTTVTIPTGAAAAVAWITMRVGDPNGIKKPQLLTWRRSGGTGSTSDIAAFSIGNKAQDVNVILNYAMSGTGTITGLPTGFETFAFRTGASGEGGLHVMGRNYTLGAWGTIDPAAVTFNTSLDFYSHNVVVKFYDDGFAQEPMQGNNGRKTTLQTWFSQKSLTDTNFGRGQSFKASGGAIKKVIAHILKSNAAQTVGTVVCKIYAHSGTFGTSSVPTGAALATSDSVNINDIPVAPNTFGYDCPIEFTFTTPFQTTNNTNYVVTIEISGNGDTNPVYAVDGYTSADAGNPCFYSAGAWASETGEAQFELIKEASTVSTIVETNAVTDSVSATETVNGSISETNATSDTPSATNATSVSIAETNPVTDTVSASVQTSGAISETNPATDTVSGTLLGNIAETNAVTDTVSSTAVENTSISETNPVTDTPNGFRTQAAPISETNAVTDTVNAILTGNIQETNAVTDTTSATQQTSRNISETNPVTDTVNGILSGNISETNAITDTPQATQVTSRNISETNAVTDTPSSTKSTSAAPISETNAVTDTVNGILLGSIVETNPVTDTINGFIPLSGNISESNAITDTPQSTLSTSGSVAETNPVTDTVNGFRTQLATISETNPVTDTPQSTLATSAAIAETNGVTDTPRGILTGTIAETNPVTDSISATVVRNDSIVETNPVTDTPSATQVTARNVSETNAVTDTPAWTVVNRLGTIAETNPVTDTVTATLQTSASIAETNPVTDNYLEQGAGAVQESNAITDTITATVVRLASIAETNPVTDSLTSSNSTSAAVSETNAVTDTPTQVAFNRLGQVQETNPVTDTTANSATYQASISEINGTTDTTNGASNSIVEESNAIIDTVNAILARFTSISEINAVTDSTSASKSVALTGVSETNPVTDTVSATVVRFASVVETNGVSDTINGFGAGDSAIIESSAITDLVTAFVQRQATIVETAPVTDALTSGRVTYGTLVESNPVVDECSSTWEGISYVRLYTPPTITYVRKSVTPTITVNRLGTNPTITYIYL